MADNIILYYFIRFVYFLCRGDKRENIFLSLGNAKRIAECFRGLFFFNSNFPFLFRHYFTKEREKERRDFARGRSSIAETLCIHFIDFVIKINSAMRYSNRLPFCSRREWYTFLMSLHVKGRGRAREQKDLYFIYFPGFSGTTDRLSATNLFVLKYAQLQGISTELLAQKCYHAAERDFVNAENKDAVVEALRLRDGFCVTFNLFLASFALNLSKLFL